MTKDLRYALHALLHDQTVGLISIFTMSVAFAVTAITLVVLDTTLLRPLPYKNVDRVFNAEIETRETNRTVRLSPSMEDMRRWGASNVLSDVAAWSEVPFGCVTHARVPLRVEARRVTESYFTLHGIQLTLGRDLSASDMDNSAPLVALLGHGFWGKHFDSADVIGKAIRCDAQVATIVGVLPPGLYPSVAIWLPLRVTASQAESRGRALTVHARLAVGVTRSEAEAHMSQALPVEPSSSTPIREPVKVRLAPVLENIISRHRATANILTGGALLVLGLAMVNVCGLFMTRTAVRRREIAVRLAVGATRARVLRQLLLEAISLTAISAIIGVAMAWAVLDWIGQILPIALLRSAQLSLSPGVVFTVGLLSLALGLVIGGIPSVKVIPHNIQEELSASVATVSGRLSRRSAQCLIAAEVALALVLAATGVSLLRSYSRLMGVNLGFDRSGVLAFKVSPVDVGAQAKLEFYSQVVQRLSTLPAVEAVGLVDHFPLADSSVSVSASTGGSSVSVGLRQMLAGYFSALGVRAIQGHVPTEILGDQRTAVVNDSAARRLFHGQAVGSTFSIGKKTFFVAAVVPDFVHGGPLQNPRPEVFVPFDPTDSRSRMLQSMTVVLKVRENHRRFPDAIDRVVRGIGPAAIIEDVRSADQWLADRLAIPRHRAILFVVLAAVGLFLMVVLVFSTTAYAVARRSAEIGLRLALGARPDAVIRRTILEVGWPVLWGLAAGALLVVVSARLLRSFLYGISPTDSGSVVAVAVMVASLALFAAWLPARRVTYVDPVETLRRN